MYCCGLFRSRVSTAPSPADYRFLANGAGARRAVGVAGRRRFWRMFMRTILWLVLPLIAVFPGIARAVGDIEFVQDTLANGLRVIYAPLRQAPVVHVAVFYHVGSRDERPDRQGFAHMFEHMMFRGSAHVKPEEHGRLITTVGGYSNAYTSFDQTVYVNTVPANQLRLALYLEADRMASFRVSEEIYAIERNVVMEEWRRRQNAPYGTFFDDFFRLAFTTHPYRWTPIGNMDHLRAAAAWELQEFFSTWYVPDNAVLVIAGDIDVAATRGMVANYFAWIPRGPLITRRIPPEPPQTAPRRLDVQRPVPLARLMIGWHVPPWRSEDHYALNMLAAILGLGNASRLDRLLVTGPDPLCTSVSAHDMALEDGGYLGISATVLAGRRVEDVEKIIFQTVADIRDRGVTSEELSRARVQTMVDYVRGRETADKIASQLGLAALLAGDPSWVNRAMRKLEAVTPADVQAVARKYLRPDCYNLLIYRPGQSDAANPASRPAGASSPGASPRQAAAGQPATRPAAFPPDYPNRPPVSETRLRATFARGEQFAINGVTVIIMPDHRLPLVSWDLAMRAGSHCDPPGKEGLAVMTADLLPRGAAGLSYVQLNEDLESRGISIDINDGGDVTRLKGSCLTAQVDHALGRTRDILLSPHLAEDEFNSLRQQTISRLRAEQSRPDIVASRTLAHALFGDSPAGRFPSPASVQNITLQDVKDCYRRLYTPDRAILVISGDVTVERGRALAGRLLEGWEMRPVPKPDYPAPAEHGKLRVILVDRPDARQSVIRIGATAYTIHSQEKFAGALAGSILSAGIDSRLGRAVRAERGLAYSVWGVFQPARQYGAFMAGAETAFASTVETVEAIFRVLNQTAASIEPRELSEAVLRAGGSMVMGMQTIQQQAAYRVEGLLNGYPIDYYDTYPDRLAGVTEKDVRDVVARYLRPERMTVVVVGPPSLREHLSRLGEVQVVAMPR